MLVKNIVSLAKREMLASGVSGTSLVKMRYSVGARQDPWGTLALIWREEDRVFLILIEKVRFVRKE